MKNLLYFFLLLCIACGTTKTDTTLPEEGQKRSDCESIEMDASFAEAPKDRYQLKGARVEGDCLAVDVSYSGGCGGATFKMLGQATVGKMPPPIILLELSFDDKDNCRGIVEKTLNFDLISVRQKQSDKVNIQLKGHERILSYEY